MIDIILEFAGMPYLVRIEKTNILFGSYSGNGQGKLAPIDGIKLSYEGVCREFPDLETKPNWNEIARERFKEKIKSFGTEEEVVDYIIQDLSKYGYIPKYKQKKGFRIEVL